MSTINVSPLSNRVTIPYGIKIEKDGAIGVIAFKYELSLGFYPGQLIKGTGFEITQESNTLFQWEGNGVTFEELWDRIFEAWEDYQEYKAFLNLTLGGCAGWVPTP